MRINQRALEAFRESRICIGASSNIGTYLLQPYMKAYLQHHESSGKVDLVIGKNPLIAERLESGELNVAILEWWDRRPGCTARLWCSEELVIIVSPEHPWRQLSRIPIQLLKDEKILGGEPGTGTGKLLQQYFGSHGKDLRVSGVYAPEQHRGQSDNG